MAHPLTQYLNFPYCELHFNLFGGSLLVEYQQRRDPILKLFIPRGRKIAESSSLERRQFQDDPDVQVELCKDWADIEVRSDTDTNCVHPVVTNMLSGWRYVHLH